MSKIFYAVTLSLLLLAGCGNKADGSYVIDIDATTATAEFQTENQKTNGGATMGLQIFSQLAETLTIEGSKFRIMTLDCKLKSDLTNADCVDVNSPSTPGKTISFSLGDGIIKMNAGDGYPIVYRNTKSLVKVTQESTPAPEAVPAPAPEAVPAPAPEAVPAPAPEAVPAAPAAPAVPAVPAVPAADNSPFAPSFDCAKASNGQEKLVCADRELSKLDVDLSQAYARAKEKTADKDKLKKEQMEWIKFSLRACSDKNCLVGSYQKRISELQ